MHERIAINSMISDWVYVSTFYEHAASCTPVNHKWKKTKQVLCPLIGAFTALAIVCGKNAFSHMSTKQSKQCLNKSHSTYCPFLSPPHYTFDLLCIVMAFVEMLKVNVILLPTRFYCIWTQWYSFDRVMREELGHIYFHIIWKWYFKLNYCTISIKDNAHVHTITIYICPTRVFLLKTLNTSVGLVSYCQCCNMQTISDNWYYLIPLQSNETQSTH